MSEPQLIEYSRYGVVAIVLLSWLLINIPGVNIVYFGLLTGCICVTFIVPSVISLIKPTLQKANYMIAGILLSLLFAFPLYAISSLNKVYDLALVGFLGCFLIPGVFGTIVPFIIDKYKSSRKE